MNNKTLYETRPHEGFNYFATNGNLPVMYVFARDDCTRYVQVFARNYSKEFPISEFDKAVAYYKMVCLENGYDIPEEQQ